MRNQGFDEKLFILLWVQFTSSAFLSKVYFQKSIRFHLYLWKCLHNAYKTYFYMVTLRPVFYTHWFTVYLVRVRSSMVLVQIFFKFILLHPPGPPMAALPPFAFIFMIAPCLSLFPHLALLLPACPLGFASAYRQNSPYSPPFQNHRHGWGEL